MKKLLLGLVFTLLSALPAAAQGLGSGNITTTGSAACSPESGCFDIDMRGVSSVGLYLNVGTSGTFVFEASIDATSKSTGTWFSITDDVGAASSATADGALFFANPGYRRLRLRATAISGTATVVAWQGQSALRTSTTVSGAGDGAIQDGASSSIEATVFDLTNSNPLSAQIVDANGDAITSFGGGTQYTEGDTDATITGTAMLFEGAGNALVAATGDATNGLDVDVTRMPANVDVQSGGGDLALEAGGNLAALLAELQTITHAEDAVHSSTQLGVMSLAVRQDVHADLAADGDYIPLTVDDAGGLRVSVVAGAAAGGTSSNFAAAFPAAGTAAGFSDGTNMVAGTIITTQADNVANTTDGVVVSALLYCFDGSTWDRCVSGDATHDSAVIATGPQIMGEAKNFDGVALPNAVTEGDAGRVAITLSGVAYTMPVNADGSLTPLVVEDAAETAANVLMGAGTVRRDAAVSSAGASGDNSTLNTDALGQLWSRFLDPCSGVAKTHIPIDIVTATTTEITAALAGASNHYYVCSINLVSAGANNVALVDDDTDNCGSVTSGVAGGTTAGEGWNFGANGGLTIGNGNGSVAKTNGTNRVLCLVTSAAVQLSGSISVAAAP